MKTKKYYGELYFSEYCSIFGEIPNYSPNLFFFSIKILIYIKFFLKTTKSRLQNFNQFFSFFQIDVWAAGIILYILLCGFPPFVSPDNQQEPLFDAIISGVYEFPEPYWTGIGDEVRDLIANMLQSDPDIRFSSEDILDHYWTLGETSEYNS